VARNGWQETVADNTGIKCPASRLFFRKVRNKGALICSTLRPIGLAKMKDWKKSKGKNVKQTLQDGPESTFLRDPLSGYPAFSRVDSTLGRAPRSSIDPKTQQKSDFGKREPKDLFVMIIFE
jgi:hypothetical protein